MRAVLMNVKNKLGFNVAKATSEAVVICLLLWAMLPINPPAFYTFLKVVMTCAALYMANRAFEQHRYLWLALFVGLAILYNPFVRVPLGDRDLWAAVNFMTALAVARFTNVRMKGAPAEP